GKRFHEIFGQPGGIAAPLRCDVCDGLPRGIAGAERIFVRIDDDSSGRNGLALRGSERWLGGGTKGHRRGGRGRPPEKRSARSICGRFELTHASLPNSENTFTIARN